MIDRPESTTAAPPFHAARYAFTLRACEPIELPAFAGGRIRGAFGAALRDVTCVTRARTCTGCYLLDSCHFPYLFETHPVGSLSEQQDRFRDAPHPLVLEPPTEGRRINANEDLTIGAVLLGRGIERLPYVIAAFHRFGERGLEILSSQRERRDGGAADDTPHAAPSRTRRFARLALSHVVNVPCGPGEPAFVFRAGDRAIQPSSHIATWDQCVARAASWQADAESGMIDVEFVTPLRLKEDGRLVSEIPFVRLLRAIVRRMSSLATFHMDGEWTAPWSFLERASEVRTVRSELRWIDYDRYSYRQHAHMKLGGVMGRVRYAGPLGTYLPFLAAAEILHLGKGSIFGLGHVRVQPIAVAASIEGSSALRT
jgi:hypothetical protein